MNLSFDASEFTSQVSPSSIPGLLWAYYVQYLWNYESDSWVARIAYSCRILAILISLPIIILGLLVGNNRTSDAIRCIQLIYTQDIASYGIARTLGVIDDVRASTSDKATLHNTMTPPDGTLTPGSESAFSDSDRDSLTDHNLHNRMRSPLSDSCANLSQPSVFYVAEDNKLSGVGVFSPAASRPPSPTSSRYRLPLDESSKKDQLRHRVRDEFKSTSAESQ